MAIFDTIANLFRQPRRTELTPPSGSYASLYPRAKAAWGELASREIRGESSADVKLVKSFLEQPASTNAISIGVPDVGFKGVRQQLFQRYNLVDLYAIAHNNSVLKTATNNLKQEVFRRGLRWDTTFDYRHSGSGRNYSLNDLQELKKLDRRRYQALLPLLREPDPHQRARFEQLMHRVNIYDQSLLTVLHALEDDLNIADDGFILLSSDYHLGWNEGKEVVRRNVRQLFRLDPVFMEFDVDQENRPGFAHHICLLHRDDLLTIPADGGWEVEWGGRCPRDGHTTFPVIYRYSPYRGTFGVGVGVQSPNTKSLYLVRGEVIHVSKFSPSELYGYSPILSIYEKSLSLIGMDRYLYDYFFERQIPQGVITTITDNPEDLERRKEQMVANVLNNPHYIPWMAVSSKTGQGRTEFTRFAYSLDELQFLPVQEHIERSVSALYGIPGLFMGFEDGMGGLNNESQQIRRLSRGAQLSQAVYNSGVLPKILQAFGITDWKLSLEVAEEYSEKFELEIKQAKASWAAALVGMGFGVDYNQTTDEYQIVGQVKSREEQEREYMMQQQEAAQGMEGEGAPGGEQQGNNPMSEQPPSKAGEDFSKDEVNELAEAWSDEEEMSDEG